MKTSQAESSGLNKEEKKQYYQSNQSPTRFQLSFLLAGRNNAAYHDVKEKNIKGEAFIISHRVHDALIIDAFDCSAKEQRVLKSWQMLPCLC